MYMETNLSETQRRAMVPAARFSILLFLAGHEESDAHQRAGDLYDLSWSFFLIRTYLAGGHIDPEDRTELCSVIRKAEQSFVRRYGDVVEPARARLCFEAIYTLLWPNAGVVFKAAQARSHWFQNVLHNAYLEHMFFWGFSAEEKP